VENTSIMDKTAGSDGSGSNYILNDPVFCLIEEINHS